MLAINALTSQTQVNVKGEDNFWKNGVVYHNLLRDDVRQILHTAIRDTKLAFCNIGICASLVVTMSWDMSLTMTSLK